MGVSTCTNLAVYISCTSRHATQQYSAFIHSFMLHLYLQLKEQHQPFLNAAKRLVMHVSCINTTAETVTETGCLNHSQLIKQVGACCHLWVHTRPHLP
jgi:diacylglycerol kinase